MAIKYRLVQRKDLSKDAATMMRPPKIRYTPGKKLMEARGTVNYVRVKGATLEPADEPQEPENPDVI